MTSPLVREFHETFGAPISDTPTLDVPEELLSLRYGLIREEILELRDAINDDDVVEVADALGDIVYVVHGAALAFGIELIEVPDFLREQAFAILGSGNPLLDDRGRREILRDVHYHIYSGDISLTTSTFHTLLQCVEHAAKKWAIPLDAVVEAIHTSNMSKLGEDGKPVYREVDQKILKGPNYHTPTADIKRLLGVDDADTEG